MKSVWIIGSTENEMKVRAEVSSDWPVVHALNEAAFETSALVRAELEPQPDYLRDAHGKIEFPAAFNNV